MFEHLHPVKYHSYSLKTETPLSHKDCFGLVFVLKMSHLIFNILTSYKFDVNLSFSGQP